MFQPTTIAIVGSGAIGLYYGGRLAEAGHRVTFLLRSDYDAVREQGLRCESVHGNFHLSEVSIARDSAEIGPVDLVIVAWKATSNHLLEKILPPLLNEKTQVLTLQNGLGNCEAIAAITGPERVMAALCFVCINRIAPGTIVHTAGGRMTIGEFLPDASGRKEGVAKLFSSAKIDTAVEENVEEAVWKKLLWNVPFNGLSIAEGGKTTDQLLADNAIVLEMRALMTEVIAAAKVRGFLLDEKLIDWNIDRTRPMGAYRPSSLIDWQEGREVEIEAIWAEPLRRAEDKGLHLPHLSRLLARIRAACA
jgi:2-dehydropantoate 2-reductase